MKDSNPPVTVAVTGAAGQIGYSLLFRIASGALFGPGRPVRLRLIEIEPAMKALEGVVMELDDCAFPLLQAVEATSSLERGFDGAHWALLVGSLPRRKGMERKDLLGANGRIFVEQGRAIQEHADSSARVLVVGNPCNTNCLIASANAPDMPRDRFYAMTRLDENRARSQLAARTGVPVSRIDRLAVWGNHSLTQYPDFVHARIGGRPATEAVGDLEWLQGPFLSTVQRRGAAVIEARGASSAASAANAAIDSVVSLDRPDPDPGDWHSVALCSRGEYGVEEGLFCSFPVRHRDGENRVVEGLELDSFSRARIDASVAELKEERSMVGDCLPR